MFIVFINIGVCQTKCENQITLIGGIRAYIDKK